MSDPKLTKISGIGPATARTLAASGFATIEAIAETTERQLAEVPGFGEARAAIVIAAAKSQLVSAASPDAGKSQQKDKKKKKKRKKKKGDKGKDRKGRNGKKDKKKKDGKKKRKKKRKKK